MKKCFIPVKVYIATQRKIKMLSTFVFRLIKSSDYDENDIQLLVLS
jgi:hypothetical protein